jgi:hypothetical protein
MLDFLSYFFLNWQFLTLYTGKRKKSRNRGGGGGGGAALQGQSPAATGSNAITKQQPALSSSSMTFPSGSPPFGVPGVAGEFTLSVPLPTALVELQQTRTANLQLAEENMRLKQALNQLSLQKQFTEIAVAVKEQDVTSKQQFSKLHEELAAIHLENERLKLENTRLLVENDNLKQQVAQLTQRVTTLESGINAIQGVNTTDPYRNEWELSIAALYFLLYSRTSTSCPNHTNGVFAY